MSGGRRTPLELLACNINPADDLPDGRRRRLRIFSVVYYSFLGLSLDICFIMSVTFIKFIYIKSISIPLIVFRIVFRRSNSEVLNREKGFFFWVTS